MRRTRTAAAVAAMAITIAACGPAPANSPVTRSSSTAPAPESSPTPSPAASAATRTAAPSSTPVSSSADYVPFFSDRYPFSIVLPAGWEIGTMGDADAFEGPAGQHVDVRYYASITEDPDAWFAKAKTVLGGFAPVASEGPIPHPAGTARWYELHPTANGQTLTLFRIVLISAGDGWDLTWVSPAGFEADDRPQFEAIASTFFPSTGPLNVWTLGTGDCFGSLPLTEAGHGGSSSIFLGPVDGFAAVDCTEPHTGEVIAALTKLEDECDGAFEPYIGRSLAGSTFALYKFIPTPRTAMPSGVEALCVVADDSGASTGTAKGSGR